jgi:hypothetical protein
MKSRGVVKFKAIIPMIAICTSFASNQACADGQVLAVTVPAHPEWCSTAKFEKSQFESTVGESTVIETGSAPILNAAFKAGAKHIGHVYVRSFRPEDAEVAATFCAVVPHFCKLMIPRSRSSRFLRPKC